MRSLTRFFRQRLIRTDLVLSAVTTVAFLTLLEKSSKWNTFFSILKVDGVSAWLFGRAIWELVLSVKKCYQNFLDHLDQMETLANLSMGVDRFSLTIELEIDSSRVCDDARTDSLTQIPWLIPNAKILQLVCSRVCYYLFKWDTFINLMLIFTLLDHQTN